MFGKKKLLAEFEIERTSLQEKLIKTQNELKKANEQIASIETEKKNILNSLQNLELQNKAFKDELDEQKREIPNKQKVLRNLEEEMETANSEYEKIKTNLKNLNDQYVIMDETVLLQSFGLYTPKYKFSTSLNYKETLENIREKQKFMITSDTAAICSKIWAVEGSVEKGKKLIESNIKQILRSFNIECDTLIQSVKFSNYETSKNRIDKAFTSLNKLNATNKIFISEEYLELKLQELDLAFEYAQKVQEEKEYLKQQRELKKEEMKLAKEIEEKRLEAEKEQQHYLNALQRIENQIIAEQNEEVISILQKRKDELFEKLEDVNRVFEDLDYREANQRAGYVYIISNIGAFGENVYKIGMTRRLEPQDRIDELGGASVPFKFDVHALIFSDDAPKLETSLHNAFENKKINAVNGRKEFFRVTLEEIEEVVKANHDKSVEFIKFPEAQQYRESIRINRINGSDS